MLVDFRLCTWLIIASGKIHTKFVFYKPATMDNESQPSTRLARFMATAKFLCRIAVLNTEYIWILL